MESKIIYAKTKAAFQRELPNIPNNLKPLVIIEDTREIWILGKYFSIGSPGVYVTDENNIINVEIGQSNFTMSSSGDNITIRKGSGNDIIFSSSALTAITTEYPLKWDIVAKKLTHEKVTLPPGSYGETASSDNVSLITIPWFTVNEWGHITNATDRNIKIRDYVEQLAGNNTLGEYNLLLGYSPNTTLETNIVRKASGLKFDNVAKTLKIQGGIEAGGDSLIVGNLTVSGGTIVGDVEGNVTGTATPKIHLSLQPEYGGASLSLYGHVKLLDAFSGIPAASSDNTNISSATVTAVAASPYLVWNVKEELKTQIANATLFTKVQINDELLNLLDIDDTLVFKFSNGLTALINPLNKDIEIKGVSLNGYVNNVLTSITDSLTFSQDFKIVNNVISFNSAARFIYETSKVSFDSAYPDKSGINDALVVLGSGYIWTNGQYFKIFKDTNPLFNTSISGSVTTVKDGDNNSLFTIDSGILSITGDTILSAVSTNGNVSLTHNKPFTVDQVSGPTANSSTTISVPQNTFDQYGHYKSGVNRTATLNYVLSTNSDGTSTTGYLVGTTNSATNTGSLVKTSKITFNPSTGVFNALTIQEGGEAISTRYAPIAHTSVTATDVISGHVVLSDSIDSNLGILSGVAATPAAVKAVYDYARNIIASGDAMVFKGTIGANGVITSSDTNISGLTLDTLTTYSSGWTFKVATAQTIGTLGTVEAGDMVIAIATKVSTYKNSDWTIIQTNIDGAVTGINLTANQLIIGNGNSTLKILAPGTEGQVLASISGVPTWTTPASSYRSIMVEGQEVISSIDPTPLHFTSNSALKIEYLPDDKQLSITTQFTNLAFYNAGTFLTTYSAAGFGATGIDFGSGLVASYNTTDKKVSVVHSSNIVAQPTKAMRSFSYDASGHIIASDVITSLPTANNLIFSDSQTVPVTKTFNGSSELTVKFNSSSADLGILANTLTANTIEYTLSLIHRYRPVSYVPTFGGTVTNLFTNSSSSTLTLAPGNSNVSLSYTSSQVRISALNTWRNVKGYNTSNILTEIYNIDNTSALQLGEDFIWDGTEFNIGWAEVSSTGVITYGN